MIRLPRFASVALSLVLCVAHVAPARAGSCLMPNEADAMHMRILQTDLMVAGLSCQLRNDYAQFVRSQKHQFSHHASVLKSYFERSGGGTSGMDRFITGLANGASSQSLQRTQSTYCQQARYFFNEVNRIPHDQLLQRLAYTPDITARRGRALCSQQASSAPTPPLRMDAPRVQTLQPNAGSPVVTSNNPRMSGRWGRRIVR